MRVAFLLYITYALIYDFALAALSAVGAILT